MATKNVSVSISADPSVLSKIDELAKTRKRSRSFLYNEGAEMLLAHRSNGHQPTPPPIKPKKKAGTR